MTSTSGAPSTLQERIDVAGGPVELLRGPEQLGPYVFQGSLRNSRTGGTNSGRGRKASRCSNSPTTCPNCTCMDRRRSPS